MFMSEVTYFRWAHCTQRHQTREQEVPGIPCLTTWLAPSPETGSTWVTRGLHGRHNNTNKTPFPPTFQKTLCTRKTIFPTQQYNNIQLFYTTHKAHTTVNPRDIIHILVTQPRPGQTTGNPGRGVVDFTGRRLKRGPPNYIENMTTKSKQYIMYSTKSLGY